MTNKPSRRNHAIVPRTLLAYAGIGIGMGVVPLTVACSSDSTGPQPIGIYPYVPPDGGTVDAGVDAFTSIGIEPAIRPDAGVDAVTSIGIRPAMEFDAGATDAARDSDLGSIGIRPAMDFDAAVTDAATSIGIEPLMRLDSGADR